MAVKGITKRWIINNLGVTVVILIAIEIGCIIAMHSFYSSTVTQAVSTRTTLVSEALNDYARENPTLFSGKVTQYIQNFTDKDQAELMAIDQKGRVVLSSSGFLMEPSPMPDFNAALVSEDGYGEFRGTLPNGEKGIAVTVRCPVYSNEYSAVRYVVSLERISRQVVIFTVVLTVIIIVLFLVIFSSSYFIRSIVQPVGEIGKTARKIAAGNFESKLPKKYNDEIGELCDTINNMADELARTEKMKNDFLSSVSHELRTPLTAIQGWGETLADCTPDDAETVSKGVRVILSETTRLSGMVEELLDFSRIQSGRMTMRFDKMDLLAELEETYLIYTQRAAAEHKTLTYDGPECAAPVSGDKNRLRQVFTNVIDNALKYSDAGDSISIVAEVNPDNIIVTVSDTGCGISKEDLPNIKQKFYKANYTRRGSGIGLAVTDEIVRMHNGELNITSELGKGTTVQIILPAAPRNNPCKEQNGEK